MRRVWDYALGGLQYIRYVMRGRVREVDISFQKTENFSKYKVKWSHLTLLFRWFVDN
jgi:hypothetical protein